MEYEVHALLHRGMLLLRNSLFLGSTVLDCSTLYDHHSSPGHFHQKWVAPRHWEKYYTLRGTLTLSCANFMQLSLSLVKVDLARLGSHDLISRTTGLANTTCRHAEAKDE